MRSLVVSSSLFASFALTIIGGVGMHSSLAAAGGDSGANAPGQNCIIAVLKTAKSQQGTAVASSSDGDQGCGITMRKAGGDQEHFAGGSSSQDGSTNR